MATGIVPASANTPEQSFPYDQLAIPQFDAAFISGDGFKPFFQAPANCNVFVSFGTVTVAGNAGAQLQIYKIAANNNANAASNLAVANVIQVGTNVAGNVFTSGPYTYNVFANGAVSSSNTAVQGGLQLLVGDVLAAVANLNTGAVVITTQYRLRNDSQFVS